MECIELHEILRVEQLDGVRIDGVVDLNNLHFVFPDVADVGPVDLENPQLVPSNTCCYEHVCSASVVKPHTLLNLRQGGQLIIADGLSLGSEVLRDA